MKKNSPLKKINIIHIGNKPITEALDGAPLGMMPNRGEMEKASVRASLVECGGNG